ncbi:nitrate- and nitrite sensing domain-containing protein [Streptomyces sp. NPDC047315]|uniref:sensor histidine kinase n=1 Tax=Streptomyces sp. NPDC047315 TaxID=3155142 RepID=UPI0033DBD6B1
MQNQGQGPTTQGNGGDRSPARPGARPAPGGPNGPGTAGPAGPGGPGGPGGRSGPGAGAGGGPQGPGGGTPTGAAPTAGDAAEAEPKLKGTGSTGSRLALRNWRISTRLVSLLTLPVAAAVTLGGLRIQESMDRMDQLKHMELLTDMTQEATKLAAALQHERDTTAGPLANDANAGDFKVTGPREATDRAYAAFLKASEGVDIKNNGEDGAQDDALDSIRTTVSQIYAQLFKLRSIREDAYVKEGSNAVTVDAYHQIINSLLNLSSDMAQATNNQEMIKRTRALAAFSAAKEFSSIQQAIIAAALPGGPGQKGDALSEGDRLYGQTALSNANNQETLFGPIYSSLGGDPAELLAPLDSGNPDIKHANEYAARVLEKQGGIDTTEKQSHLDWTHKYSSRMEAMKRIEATLLDEMESKARQLREDSKQDAILNGVLILFVLGVSLVGAFIVSRSMIRSLRRLQDTATKVAQERLPELVKQLSETDPQDVDTSVESVGVHSRDEIGKVAAAFDDVHREAVRLAAEQALLRGNVNAMFTNLSRRSQGLIQRQLSLISELESREADPDQLSSLFKLDHLATRMRRNGENLLVLAGEEPGRRWTRPVPLVDVLRAAASEVEQYERIELAAVPATDVAGRVVNDLVHLLAELLENATSFSSPQTKVRVTGHALPDGRVLVEIHDTGIGLSPEDLAAINERLASPPTVDVSVSRRMGLFVVGRLSLRHGIRIQLRPSDSGGTTALVMLPVDVAQGGRKPMGGPGGHGPQGPQGPQGGPGGQGTVSAPGGAAPVGAGRPGGGQGAPGGGLLGGNPPRGQVGAGAGAGAALGTGPGNGPRASLPARDGGQGRQGGGLASAFSGRGGQRNAPASGPSAPAAPGLPARPETAALPQPGTPARAELPGAGQQRPQGTSWGSDQRPGGRDADTARGHDDLGAVQGPGATAEIPRQDFTAPPPADFGAPALRPAPTEASHATNTPNASDTGEFPSPEAVAPAQQHRPPNAPNGQFVRSDVFGPPGGAGGPARPVQDGGQFAPPRDGGADGFRDRGQQDPAATGQFARPDMVAPQPPAPGRAPAPRGFEEQEGPVRGELPAQPQHEALPPAPGPGDGRTPLYDTLETDWFRTQSRSGQGNQGAAAYDEQPRQEGEAHDGVDSTQQFQQIRPLQQTPQAPQFPQVQQAPQAQQAPPAQQVPQAPAPQQTQAIPQIPQVPQAPFQQAPQAPQSPQFPESQQGPQAPQFPQTSQTPQAPQGPRGPEAARDLPDAGGPLPRRNGGAFGAIPSDGPEGESWRTSPNDELGRQAERIRKPTSGGVTTSGLPRRVPRANLVAGTAQQQSGQSGPSVSRAPDDVRGRLTKLRRGIQQGREQNSSTTGSFNLGPTHQQER